MTPRMPETTCIRDWLLLLQAKQMSLDAFPHMVMFLSVGRVLFRHRTVKL